MNYDNTSSKSYVLQESTNHDVLFNFPDTFELVKLLITRC